MQGPLQEIEQKSGPPPSGGHFATVNGQAVMDLPQDLYVPPGAMTVFLEAFEGPLDFLLYLIKKQNIDILNIPVASVTRQYMEYIDLVRELSLELAGDYLVMAALLAEIKSRMLLPRPANVEQTEEDPRAELVRRLLEYERYKQAAEGLQAMPQLEREVFLVQVDTGLLFRERPLPMVSMAQLSYAMMDIIKRSELVTSHLVRMEALSVREKMAHILTALQQNNHAELTSLFVVDEGRLGIVVTFLAMLELLKQHLIEFVQAAPFSPIYLKTKSGPLPS